jgi:hypothetical protein
MERTAFSKLQAPPEFKCECAASRVYGDLCALFSSTRRSRGFFSEYKDKTLRGAPGNRCFAQRSGYPLLRCFGCNVLFLVIALKGYRSHFG